MRRCINLKENGTEQVRPVVVREMYRWMAKGRRKFIKRIKFVKFSVVNWRPTKSFTKQLKLDIKARTWREKPTAEKCYTNKIKEKVAVKTEKKQTKKKEKDDDPCGPVWRGRGTEK